MRERGVSDILGDSQTSGPSPRVMDLEEECFSRVHFVKIIA